MAQPTAPVQDLTPSQIVAELDKYIVGQQEAKKAVAIALRNRIRRLRVAPEMRREIVPNNILLIGATGVGKTEIARRLAELADAPFVKVEASKFTEVGYVGRDVESMVRDLAEQAVARVRAQRMAQVREAAAQRAEDELLDLLLPRTPGGKPLGSGFSLGASGADDEQYTRTREKFREMLRRGELNGREVEIEVNVPTPNVQVMGPGGMEGMDGLQDMLQNMMPKRRKKRKATVAEAKELLIEEEAQKLIDMDAVQREALDKAQQSGIIFIDEIDKVASRGANQGGPDVSRQGVQRDLLPIVEGSTVNTKYGPVKTDHVLFIAAGAFHMAKPSDLIPELQGRFPIRVELQPLTEVDFVKILKHPRNALTKQYQALLETEGVQLTFSDDALDEIARTAFQVNQEVENIGARRLHTVMSNLLDFILFTVPDLDPTPHFAIDADFVRTKLARLVKQRELSEYIL